MPKLLGLIRVSTDPQSDGEGPEEQKAGILQCIANIGWLKDYKPEFKPYVQSTSKITKLQERKDLSDIKANLEQGDVLAFWNIKRFSRNHVPAIAFVNELKEEGKVQYIIIGSKIYNLYSVDDEAQIATDLVSIYKENYYDFKTRYDGKISLKGKGYFVGGRVPYGYKLERVKEGRRYRTHLVVDEAQKEIYLEMIGLLLQGHNPRYIANDLNKRGIKPAGFNSNYEKYLTNDTPRTWKRLNKEWKGTSVWNILSNPFYYGMMKVKDGYVKGQHKPLISKERWNQIQQVLSSMKKVIRLGPPRIREIIGRDVFVCGFCGTTLVGKIERVERQRPKEAYDWKRYCCPTCRKARKEALKEERPIPDGLPLLDMDSADSVLWGKVKYLIKNSDKLKALITEWQNNQTANKAESISSLERIQRSIDNMTSQRLDLLDCIGMEGFTKEEIMAKARGYQARIEELKVEYTQIHDQVHAESKTTHTLSSVMPLLNKLTYKIDNLPTSQWNKYIRMFLDRVIVGYEGGCFSFKFEGVLDILELSKTDCELNVLS